MLLAGAIAAWIALRARTDFEAKVARLPGAPFTIEDGNVRNGFEVHLVNKVSHRAGFDVRVDAPKRASTVLAVSHVDLDPLAQSNVVFFVTAPREAPRPVRKHDVDAEAEGAGIRIAKRYQPIDVVVVEVMEQGVRNAYDDQV